MSEQDSTSVEPVIQMYDYMLTVRYTFKGMDDMSGRQQAKEILARLNPGPDATIKLQKIFQAKQPVEMSLEPAKVEP